MPFWTLFWLIVPAVLYLAISVAFYRLTRDLEDEGTGAARGSRPAERSDPSGSAGR